MADCGLTEEYRCGYCYELFGSMNDPRALPCHHVFCIKCLQENYLDQKSTCCRICQKVYQTLDFQGLPSVQLNTAEVSTAACDCYNCEEKTAVCYCGTCARKMCDTHQQSHMGMFGDSHQVIPISVYKISPGKYKDVACKEHKEKLIMACSDCKRFLCHRCDISNEKCTDGRTNHNIRFFHVLNAEITSHFKQKLTSANDEITKICKLDKEAWKKLDEEELECQEQITTIERDRDKMKQAIEDNNEKLKEPIYEYRSAIANQIVLYNSKLMAKKDQLENTCTETREWLRDSHVGERVEKREEMTKRLEALSLEKDASLELTCKPVIVSKDITLAQDVAYVFTTLTLLSQNYTGCQCNAVCYKDDGDLFLGVHDGVKLLKQGDKQLVNYGKVRKSVKSIVVHRGNVFALYQADHVYEVDIVIPNMHQRNKLFEFPRVDDNAQLAVSDLYIAVTSGHPSYIVLYDMHTRSIVHHKSISSIAINFLPFGDLLVANGSNCLVRYNINGGQLTRVWMCGQISSPSRICTDDCHLIYVLASGQDKTVYIVSPSGVLLGLNRNSMLPDNPGQFSINTTKLAVPDCGRGASLFHINRQVVEMIYVEVAVLSWTCSDKIPMKVNLCSTIEELKKQIAEQHGMPLDKQHRLIFGGTDLTSRCEFTLAYIGIQEGSTIFLDEFFSNNSKQV